MGGSRATSRLLVRRARCFVSCACPGATQIGSLSKPAREHEQLGAAGSGRPEAHMGTNLAKLAEERARVSVRLRRHCARSPLASPRCGHPAVRRRVVRGPRAPSKPMRRGAGPDGPAPAARWAAGWASALPDSKVRRSCTPATHNGRGPVTLACACGKPARGAQKRALERVLRGRVG